MYFFYKKIYNWRILERDVVMSTVELCKIELPKMVHKDYILPSPSLLYFTRGELAAWLVGEPDGEGREAPRAKGEPRLRSIKRRKLEF